MAAEAAPYGRVTQKAPAVAEVHVVWITAGLGCDGDSVSINSGNATKYRRRNFGRHPWAA